MIDWYQQDTAGLVIGTDGMYIIVSYQSKLASLKKGVMYRADEFEVISEGR